MTYAMGAMLVIGVLYLGATAFIVDAVGKSKG